MRQLREQIKLKKFYRTDFFSNFKSTFIIEGSMTNWNIKTSYIRIWSLNAIYKLYV